MPEKTHQHLKNEALSKPSVCKLRINYRLPNRLSVIKLDILYTLYQYTPAESTQENSPIKI